MPRPRPAAPMSRARAAALAALLVTTAPAVPATEPDPLRSHLRESPRLLGDPGGVRSGLEARGIDLQLFFNHTAGITARGGNGNTGVPRQSGSADFFAVADLGELGLVRGARGLLHLKSTYNRNVNGDVNALSDPIDDADFDEPIYVSELWLDQTLFGNRLLVRAGYLDQQVVFDRNVYANSEDRQFMSSFLDNNNAVIPLQVGLGATLVLRPTEWLELAVGTADADNEVREAGFDTAFDGVESLTGYFEWKLRWSPVGPRGVLPGHYRLGAFVDGSRKTVFDGGGRRRGHWGGYLSFDQLVHRERSEDLQGLGLFFRWGYADPEVNRITGFLSGGLQYLGLLPKRDADVLGVGVYHTLPSDDFRDEVNGDFDSETGVEVYYRIQPVPWLTVTPAAQWIHDPGGLDSARDALVVALRTRVTF